MNMTALAIAAVGLTGIILSLKLNHLAKNK
jgi:hypothetical protein